MECTSNPSLFMAAFALGFALMALIVQGMFFYLKWRDRKNGPT